MTINKAIIRVDDLRPGGSSTEEKLRWLEELEGRIRVEVLERYEGELPDLPDFDRVEFDMQSELQASGPYEALYIHYVAMMISYRMEEYDAYNTEKQMFESLYSGWRNEYNRTHQHKQVKKSYKQ